MDASLISLLTTALTVLLNYEGLTLMSRSMEKLARYGRRRFLILMFGLLLVQFSSVLVFALGFMILDLLELGKALNGTGILLDFLYLSASSYSTVGFGDVVPGGGSRLLASVEAIVGFMMITWSASLTFIEMQRHWKR